MLPTLSEQALVFLQMVAVGVCSGLLYDLLRAFCGSIFKSAVAVGVGELIFWGLETVLVVGSIYVFNSGALRFFVFLGMLLGQILYFLLASRTVCTIFVWILRRMLKIFQVFFKILLTPTRLLYKILLVYIFRMRRRFFLSGKAERNVLN